MGALMSSLVKFRPATPEKRYVRHQTGHRRRVNPRICERKLDNMQTIVLA